MAQKKKPSAIREKNESIQQLDFTSLNDFIDKSIKGEKKAVEAYVKAKDKAQKDLQKQQLKQERELVQQLARLEQDLQSQGLSLTASQRKKYLLDYQNQQKKEEDKRVLEYWKTFSKEYQNQQKKEQSQLEKEKKVWKEIATLRDANNKMEEENLNKQKEIDSLRDKYIKAIEEGNREEAENISKREKQLKEEIANNKDKQKKNEKEASKKENKEENKDEYSFEDGLNKVFEDAFSDLLKEVDKSPKDNLGEVLGKDLLDTLSGVGKAIEEGLNQINNTISTYADYQTSINARMQGTSESTVDIFSNLQSNLQHVAYSPLLKSEELFENLNSLIAEGIASNVEQKAFLQTIKDGIATTFDVNNEALKRIIRLQQYDTTASRLGMEAYLTSYLNELVKNTEYLNSTFDSVADSLVEASALMDAQKSTEFEYVVQKWLGTLTGLGMDESTATNIASAIGYLGSGDIESLSSSNLQNLLVMASARSGLNYSDLLANGLTADTTNQLMYNVVTYMAELGSNSNNVVKSQLASTFGVNVSDLISAKNIVQDNAQNSTITNLYNNLLTYNDMYNELTTQMNQLAEREGVANILDNLFSNFVYTTGTNIASNPTLFATWKVTDLIQSVTQGINIPYVSAFGNGLDLNTTVENLMKLGIVGISTLGGIGDIISGISTVGSGSSLLNIMGISANADNSITRGTGINTRATGVGTSISTMIGNANGSDYMSQALTSAEDSQQEKVDATREENTSIDELNNYIQGEGKEISQSTLDSINELNRKIENGITVRFEQSITGMV